MIQGLEDRKYWVDTLVRIIDPVLTGGDARTLKRDFLHVNETLRKQACNFAVLEAVGRTLCGAAPWLEQPQTDPAEEALRQKYAILARSTIDGITDPNSSDCAEFYVSIQDNGGNPFVQSLVDAAFLSHAILRAPKELYEKLEPRVKNNLIACLKETRRCRPAHNNWLLFSGMVEAALYLMGEEPDLMRVDYCLSQHEQWYKGDGLYGDGASFHWDYYNSYVIQPMIVDIVKVFRDFFPENQYGQKRVDMAVKHGTRYAAILERLIAPDGSFPVFGRSVTYRTGAFQMLAQAALQDMLPSNVTKPQVRSALTAVIRRCFERPENFDENGWLKVGVCGDQPSLGELYICAGSLYLCTTGFLPLGLSADDTFWNSEYEDYTSRKLWAGQNLPADHSI